MDTNWHLQTSIHLLNNFCADRETFSYRALAHLKLEGLILRVNAKQQELTMIISTDEDYQTLREFLKPSQRLYQLLGIHFKMVHLVYGLPNEPAEKGIHLETFSLDSSPQSTDLRAPNSLGSRLRRALNIALQGHIGMLWLHNTDDIERLEALWKRGRITQLLDKQGIMHCYDFSEQLVKLWKTEQVDESKRVVITIK
jgi:Tat protein secretion system quality control protein TatD with DNase activity